MSCFTFGAAIPTAARYVTSAALTGSAPRWRRCVRAPPPRAPPAERGGLKGETAPRSRWAPPGVERAAECARPPSGRTPNSARTNEHASSTACATERARRCAHRKRSERSTPRPPPARGRPRCRSRSPPPPPAPLSPNRALIPRRPLMSADGGGGEGGGSAGCGGSERCAETDPEKWGVKDREGGAALCIQNALVFTNADAEMIPPQWKQITAP